MTWVLDILSIFFVVGLSVYGIKVGFFKSIVDFALVIICMAGAGFLAYISVLKLFDSWGFVSDLAIFWSNLLGDSKINGGQIVVDTVAYYISFGILTLITFIVYYVLLNLLRKLICKIAGSINKRIGLLNFFDKLLGFLITFTFSAGLVLGIMAFIHAFAGSALFANLNEAYMASEILSLIYDINPLNSVIENTGIADMLIASFESFSQTA